MILELTDEQLGEFLDETIGSKSKEGKWVRLDAVITREGLLFWPWVNKEAGRLVFEQHQGDLTEVDVQEVGLNVSRESDLTRLIDLIVDQIPSERCHKLQDFLKGAYRKYRVLFEELKNSLGDENPISAS